MRKKELIQIHALLLEVTLHWVENENMPAETCSTYHALDVRPSSIHKSKQDHHDAITALEHSIEWWIEHTHSTELHYRIN